MIDDCPICGSDFAPFLRGLIHRSFWLSPIEWLMDVLRWGSPGRALVCSVCKDVVGYESPLGELEEL